MHGGTNLLRASLVLDGGTPLADQSVGLTGATADGNVWTPVPVGTATTVDSDTTTPLAKTCTLPQAALRWAKTNPSPAAAVNGGQSIQPGDPGLHYRNVDCKYHLQPGCQQSRSERGDPRRHVSRVGEYRRREYRQPRDVHPALIGSIGSSAFTPPCLWLPPSGGSPLRQAGRPERIEGDESIARSAARRRI